MSKYFLKLMVKLNGLTQICSTQLHDFAILQYIPIKHSKVYFQISIYHDILDRDK